MIKKYGTLQPVTVVETKDIPSWIGASVPVVTKEASAADTSVDEKEPEVESEEGE